MIIRLQAVVKDVQGKTATLITDDQQELTIPISDTNSSLSVDDRCMIVVQPLDEAMLDQAELSRTILNTLIAHEQDQEN